MAETKEKTADSAAGQVSTAERVSTVELDRRRYRKKAQLKSILVSLASSVVVAAVLIYLVINSKGWSEVQKTFFNPEYFAKALPRVAEGLLLNLQVLFFAIIGVAIFASLLAVMRTLRGAIFMPLRIIATAYVDLVRGVPVILTLYLVGFGIPALEITPRLDPAFWGAVAIIICYSAYVAEVLRSGIESVHPSQRTAARALGLNYGQTLRQVVMPQAVRKVTPALMNDFVAMQKDVGLISVLGAVDAIRAAQIINQSTFNYTPYVLAGIFFILMSLPFLWLTEWLNRRARQREQVGGIV